jgi:NADPH:quinone reductase-like Zn-dependent oxidoreductase
MIDSDARAVRFDCLGGIEVLYLADVPMPALALGEVVAAARTADINPGEAGIRSGGDE